MSAFAAGAVIAVGSDHAAVALRLAVVDRLKAMGFDVRDLGPDGGESVDYPDCAQPVVAAIETGEAAGGVLLCGSGVGISIAANRSRAIRAALCGDVTTARLSRAHNDANVLAMGARVTGAGVALDCVDAFFTEAFEGGRHARRVAKMS